MKSSHQSNPLFPPSHPLHPNPHPPYFIFALPLSGFDDTGSPLMPCVPGLFWLGSWPTLVEPESDATGASPGRWPSEWPAALSAPRPCFSACCFWNFSLAPEPPLGGIWVSL
jgi:hypothetical protein